MKIVVIGGTGLIGSKVVTKLTEDGHEVVPASPRLGINTFTGEGLATARDGDAGGGHGSGAGGGPGFAEAGDPHVHGWRPRHGPRRRLGRRRRVELAVLRLRA